MALISCPSCQKRISSKAQSCNHCGFSLGNASQEDLLRKERLNRFKKFQSLNNQSLLAVLLFVAGFAYMYWGGVRPNETEYTIAMSMSATGFIWYIINRVRIVIAKRTN